MLKGLKKLDFSRDRSSSKRREDSNSRRRERSPFERKDSSKRVFVLVDLNVKTILKGL